MPFPRSYHNPHLVNSHLSIKHANKNMTLDLDTCLSISDGKLVWGGHGGFSALRNQSLSGSDFIGEVEYHGKWIEVELDLSTNIVVKDHKLVYVPTLPPPIFKPVNGNGHIVSPYTSPLPLHETSFTSDLKEYRSSHKITTYSERSSSFFKFSVGNTLTLIKSVLHAKCRIFGVRELSSTQLDLNPYIGVVNGKLVWGREGFYAACKNIHLEGFILHAECEDESKNVVRSTLDLSRYLCVYNGILSVKVATDMTYLSGLFADAPWLKFKVVTEPNANGVLGAVGEGAVKSAFSALAKTTSKHVEAEIKQEYSVSAAEYLKDAMTVEVKAQLTEAVAHTIGKKVREELSLKIEAAFRSAQHAVNTACDEMIDAAATGVAVKYTESVIGPMQHRIIEACDAYLQKSLTEVSNTAIAQFQEGAEIMMERELVAASVHRAQTKAHLLEMFAATLDHGTPKFGF
ncbi:hypothetical protein GYMLUDRAFT_236053 [Collybiopsis luxurians FD-317 M1]|nr:hypothetical protein GYMLUDRAFT_236053 [Collybiopsis luxurians FD-317 M1]